MRYRCSWPPSQGGPVHGCMNSLLVFLLLIDSKKQQGDKMQMSPEKSLSETLK